MAMADDPNDPLMRDPKARAKDKAIIRQLNLNQLAYVQKRDAEYAKQWKAWREYHENRRAGRDDSDSYAEARARHERDMAAWRRAVRLCEAGQYEYCAR
ncbi:MAG: hypothetical protein ACKOPE_04885 [Novosphingobium sp.]